jgi:hypothetical protein
MVFSYQTQMGGKAMEDEIFELHHCLRHIAWLQNTTSISTFTILFEESIVYLTLYPCRASHGVKTTLQDMH